jgi:hypothetical protein
LEIPLEQEISPIFLSLKETQHRERERVERKREREREREASDGRIEGLVHNINGGKEGYKVGKSKRTRFCFGYGWVGRFIEVGVVESEKESKSSWIFAK